MREKTQKKPHKIHIPITEQEIRDMVAAKSPDPVRLKQIISYLEIQKKVKKCDKKELDGYVQQLKEKRKKIRLSNDGLEIMSIQKRIRNERVAALKAFHRLRVGRYSFYYQECGNSRGVYFQRCQDGRKLNGYVSSQPEVVAAYIKSLQEREREEQNVQEKQNNADRLDGNTVVGAMDILPEKSNPSGAQNS